MHSNLIEAQKQKISLSAYQRAIIVGTLLGDGHLETENNGKTYRLKIEHSIKQKEYVDWLYKQLKPLIGMLPKSRTREIFLPRAKQKAIRTYSFSTYSLASLRFYGQQFYSDGRKIVPKLINKIFRPVSLAIWYLDDGSYKSEQHKTFIIHTNRYSKNDLKRLQEMFLRLGIKTRLHKQKQEKGICWRIYVLSESAEIFRGIVEPIIRQIPSMMYKLGNNLPKK